MKRLTIGALLLAISGCSTVDQIAAVATNSYPIDTEKALSTYESKFQYLKARQEYERSGQDQNVLIDHLTQICLVNPDAMFDLWEIYGSKGEESFKCGNAQNQIYISRNDVALALIELGNSKLIKILAESEKSRLERIRANRAWGQFVSDDDIAWALHLAMASARLGHKDAGRQVSYFEALAKDKGRLSGRANKNGDSITSDGIMVSAKLKLARIKPYAASLELNGCTPETCKLTPDQETSINQEVAKVSDARAAYLAEIETQKAARAKAIAKAIASEKAAEAARARAASAERQRIADQKAEEQRIVEENARIELEKIKAANIAANKAYQGRINSLLMPEDAGRYIIINQDSILRSGIVINEDTLMTIASKWHDRLSASDIGEFKPSEKGEFESSNDYSERIEHEKKSFEEHKEFTLSERKSDQFKILSWIFSDHDALISIGDVDYDADKEAFTVQITSNRDTLATGELSIPRNEAREIKDVIQQATVSISLEYTEQNNDRNQPYLNISSIVLRDDPEKNLYSLENITVKSFPSPLDISEKRIREREQRIAKAEADRQERREEENKNRLFKIQNKSYLPKGMCGCDNLLRAQLLCPSFASFKNSPYQLATIVEKAEAVGCHSMPIRMKLSDVEVLNNGVIKFKTPHGNTGYTHISNIEY